MLQTQSVNPNLLRVLKELMSIELLHSLNLVGGTSLALQIGHRVSIDIDLFGAIDFDYPKIVHDFRSIGNVRILSQSKHINIFSIDDIKVDFVNYSYPLLDPIIIEDGIRMISTKDIAAMKLNAIAGRGSKKDFIDLYYLLREYSIEEIYEFYRRKYKDGNLFLVQKSLVYFNDADLERTPKIFDDIRWEDIKKEIVKQIF